MKNRAGKLKNYKSLIRNLHSRVPLTMKMVVLTLVIGLIAWILLDHIQTAKLRNIFYAELAENLGNHAMEDRLSFDRYVKTFQESAKLFVTQKNFSDYIERQRWSAEDTDQITYFRKLPEWFPNRSVLRIFTQPRYALLLNPQRKTREVYQSRQDTVPSSLLSPTRLLIEKSYHQSFITALDNTPYLITSESYFNSRGKILALLILASPIDDEFLTESLDTVHEKHLIALLTSEEDPRILASNNLEEIPAGTPISTLQSRYLVTGNEFFDYGASEIHIKFASFASIEEVDMLTNKVVSRARQERATLAFVLILTSALIIYWIAQHIQHIIQRIADFSRHTLGMKPQELQKGDQIHILRKRFQLLTEEVLVSREIIKRQAEEQTRMIVNNASDAIITTDTNGVITSWNPRAETIFGWSREKAVGQIIYDIIVSPQYRKTCKKTFARFMTTGKRQTLNMQIIITACHRDGHKFAAELTASPAGSANNCIFIFIIRDITERSRTEKKIKDLLKTVTKAKSEWETTFDTVTEIIMLVDKELNIIRCNKSFVEFSKQSTDTLIGKKCHEFLLCEQKCRTVQEYVKINEQMEKTEIRTETGHWLYVSHLPVLDEKGEYLYTIITATDITELKNTQQTLMESKKELKERVDELENFYEMAMNRELKMIELKKEVSKLKTEIEKSESIEI